MTTTGWSHVRQAASLTLRRPEGPLTATALQALGAQLKSFAQDADLYCVLLADNMLALTSADLEDEAAPAVADVIWRLDCFSKPVVSFMRGTVGELGLALALAGTHRVAAPGTTFRLDSLGRGRLPPGNLLRTLAGLTDLERQKAILGGATVGPVEAYQLGWITHVISADHFEAMRADLAAAEPVDPVCDDRASPPTEDIVAPDLTTSQPPAPPVQNVSDAQWHAFKACRKADPREVLMCAARYDEALRRLGAGVAPDVLDAMAGGIDLVLPERRVLQAYRAR